MSPKKQKHQSPLNDGLVAALKALDNQVARAMQRTPSERDEHGVQKWEPYRERIERVTTLLLESHANEELELDGLLVLSQALAKTLSLLTEELGKDGLGQIRGSYLIEAASSLERDARRINETLQEQPALN